MLHSNVQFLAQLAKLFESSKDKGTVYITYKRYNYAIKRQNIAARKLEPKPTPPAKPSPPLPTDPSADENVYPCLVRAVSGKSKISTLVEPKDLAKFQEGCGNVFRVHMDSLKKKERVKKGKTVGGEKTDAGGVSKSKSKSKTKKGAKEVAVAVKKEVKRDS
ncbi:RNA-binding signal recognition particle subunit srp14 [Chytridiales sp. JEL 0842]|nr:RNA-binding signal recognition particle subunit srp14 [Chytridiales sp. JEL 0842]